MQAIETYLTIELTIEMFLKIICQTETWHIRVGSERARGKEIVRERERAGEKEREKRLYKFDHNHNTKSETI